MGKGKAMLQIVLHGAAGNGRKMAESLGFARSPLAT
jgi:hypothetical protein